MTSESLSHFLKSFFTPNPGLCLFLCKPDPFAILKPVDTVINRVPQLEQQSRHTLSKQPPLLSVASLHGAVALLEALGTAG